MYSNFGLWYDKEVQLSVIWRNAGIRGRLSGTAVRKGKRPEGERMARNPYRKDYRLVEEFSGKGRVKTSYEYIGEACVFREGESAAHAWARRGALLVSAGWILYIGAMFFESEAMRRLYVALPFAFCGVPLALITGHVFAMRSLKEPLEKRHMDRFNNRYPQAALFLTLFAVFALLGESAGLAGAFFRPAGGKPAGTFAGLLNPGEILFLAGNAGLCLCGVLLMKGRAHLRVETAAKEGTDDK